MSKKRRKHKKPRLRRIKRKERKATLWEKVELVKTIESHLGIDITAPPPKQIFLPVKKPYFANTEDVLRRIRENAEKEVARDPLLN